MTVQPATEPQGTDTPPAAKPVDPLPESESALAAALKADAERRIYTGHPAAMEEETPDPDEVGKEEGAAKGKGKDKGKDKGKGPGETELAPGDKKKPAGEGEEDELDELGYDKPPKLKGKTHEEEARLRSEAERWAHEKGQENKKLLERLDALDAEIKELKAGKKGPEAPPEPPGGEAGDKPPKVAPTAAAKERIQKVLLKMDELDRYSDDYYEKAAELWAEAGLGSYPVPKQEELNRMVQDAVQAQLAKEKEAKTEADRAVKAEAKANKMAAKLGLDMDPDEDGNPSVDYDMFWDASARAPKGIPFEDQVKWTVKEVKRLKGVAHADLKKKAEATETHQRGNEILERGSRGPEATTPKKVPKLSLTDALTRTQRHI